MGGSGRGIGMAERTERRKLRQLETWLRAHFPPPLDFKVKVICADHTLGRDLMGTTYLKNGVFIIRIRRSLAGYAQRETLLHEWAHVRTLWFLTYERSHADEFWLEFGRIYRAFHESEPGGSSSRGL